MDNLRKLAPVACIALGIVIGWLIPEGRPFFDGWTVREVLSLWRLVASWPVATVVVGTTFFVLFRRPIARLIRNLKASYENEKGRWEIAAAVAREKQPPPQLPAPPPTPEADEAQAGVPVVPTAEGAAILREQAITWRMRYLAALVRDQALSALYYLREKDAVPESEFEEKLAEATLTDEGRHNTMKTLLGEVLIAVADGKVSLTKIGRRFVKWRDKEGLQPPLSLAGHKLAKAMLLHTDKPIPDSALLRLLRDQNKG